MSWKNENVELNIISASQVRRYARGELLPEEQRELIEQTLLDDDRARRLVAQEKQIESSAFYMTEETSRRLSDALSACMKALVSYEVLSSRDGPKTVRDYAASRFYNRWRLNEELGKILSLDYEADIDITSFICPEISGADAKTAIQIAKNRDQELLDALKAAYVAPSGAKIKAKIADWISAIEFDISQVLWLSGASIIKTA